MLNLFIQLAGATSADIWQPGSRSGLPDDADPDPGRAHQLRRRRQPLYVRVRIRQAAPCQQVSRLLNYELYKCRQKGGAKT